MKFLYKCILVLLAGVFYFQFSVISFAAQVENTQSDEDSGEISQEASEDIPIESNLIPGWPQGPAINSEAAVVMDAKTGAILYEKNMNAAEYPASITKIMTALVALENSSLDEIVTFSDNAVFSIERDSSHIARTTGEQLTMEQCLYALLLESANECANAIAEHVAGSVDAFAGMMNQKAQELGCTNTHFVNPHGLHDENHYTTARDMAVIVQAALQNDTFRTIAGTAQYTLPATNKNDEELMMFHHHAMMSKHRTAQYYDETVFAGKNGYTTDALNTLVTCANRNDMEVICVTMRTESGYSYPDTASLLDYVTGNFTKTALPSTFESLPEDIQASVLSSLGASSVTESSAADDSPGYAVVPNTLSLENLTPAVSTTERTDADAEEVISYMYEDRCLGCVALRLSYTPLEAPAASAAPAQSGGAQAPQDETSGLSSREETSGGFFFYLKYVLFAAVALAAVIFLVTIVLTVRNRIAIHRRRRERLRKRLLRKKSVNEDSYF